MPIVLISESLLRRSTATDERLLRGRVGVPPFPGHIQ